MSAALSCCPLDGALRYRVERDGLAWWHCPWCSDNERIEPDPIRSAMQDTFDRKAHP